MATEVGLACIVRVVADRGFTFTPDDIAALAASRQIADALGDPPIYARLVAESTRRVRRYRRARESLRRGNTTAAAAWIAVAANDEGDTP